VAIVVPMLKQLGIEVGMVAGIDVRLVRAYPECCRFSTRAP